MAPVLDTTELTPALKKALEAPKGAKKTSKNQAQCFRGYVSLRESSTNNRSIIFLLKKQTAPTNQQKIKDNSI